MEPIKILIYIHAFFGGLGLTSGIINIFKTKGGIKHKVIGRIFSYSMLTSSFISLVIARMSEHENLFLFLIGIFTIYMILSGNRALTLKSKTKADWIDKIISGTMLVTSIGMIVIGITGVIQKIDNSILYIFFGCVGTFMTCKDFHTFRIFTKKKNAWLISHLGRMVGALIASITAFLVAALNIGTLSVWILPTILGIGYIIYWNKKITN